MMVTQWGMSERLGPVSFRTLRGAPVPGPRDDRAARPLRAHRRRSSTRKSAASSARPTSAPIRLLEEHRDELERLTEALIEREVLTVAEIEELIGKRGPRSEPRRRADDDRSPRDNPSRRPVARRLRGSAIRCGLTASMRTAPRG